MKKWPWQPDGQALPTQIRRPEGHKSEYFEWLGCFYLWRLRCGANLVVPKDFRCIFPFSVVRIIFTNIIFFLLSFQILNPWHIHKLLLARFTIIEMWSTQHVAFFKSNVSKPAVPPQTASLKDQTNSSHLYRGLSSSNISINKFYVMSRSHKSLLIFQVCNVIVVKVAITSGGFEISVCRRIRR